MNDFKLLAELISAAIHEKEEKSRNNVYILKSETADKIGVIRDCIRNDSTKLDISFDTTFNALDIEIRNYVFDSKTDDLRTIFNTIDVAVIDALIDGEVCIQMRILNACSVTRSKEVK